MLDTSHNNADFGLYRRMLAENNLILTNIAQGAPLAQTLADIATSIEIQNPEIWAVIFLLDESGKHLRLAAAPSLHPDCSCAIDGIGVETGTWPQCAASDTLVDTATEDLEASQFWRRFSGVVQEHGLYACVAVPIRSMHKGILGIVAACLQQPDRGGDKHRQALADVTALATIAIERHIDQTEIRRAENAALERETRIALAIEGSGTGVWDRNVATGEIHYSTGWKAILGYTDSEIGNRIEESYTRVHPDDLAYVKATIQAHFDRKTDSYSVEHRIRCKDGSYKWISSRGKVVSRDAEGNPLRMIGTTTDITAMRALSERLQQSVDLITSLTNEVPGLVFQYCQMPDGAAFFSYASEGIRDIYEIAPEQVATDVSVMREIIHPDDYQNYSASIAASAASLMPWHLEYRVILPTQGLRWRQGDARPRRLPDGRTLWHGFISDVTERKRIETELQEFATIDFLTQLPNRRCFMARMEEELARIQRSNGMSAAVLMCDLDYFKAINDGYGHAIGDQVLKHFATILREALRKNDTVGRVGGEEFAVILADTGFAEAALFARRVQKQIADAPFVGGGEIIPVTVSIGISAMKPSDANVAASLSRSDTALYRAKGSGRNCVEIAFD
ncbi:diguanylate cyclase [Paralcaligenes sp. KSB-10]|uniref:diguanylate cyclase n=1 Tax=Paralcaligenes sp. KSB-10 TaxID=2901142 RepID=UPI001E2AD4A3|nr:diguanylate cyclase [Paralcaligenes sp. KSB-10]UHL63489.1 diguanylate cyclase [Paralcaligenes sp. KSB-10]